MATHPKRGGFPTGGPMTLEDFHMLEENFPDMRYEYIDGIAYLMAGGSREHNLISQNVASTFRDHFGGGPCFAYTENMQTLVGTKKSGKKHFMYPDVVVSCNPRDHRRGNTLIEEPKIVIEVLSPSTEAKDRGSKLKAYKACPSIQEIALINQYARHIEIYRRDGDVWRYNVYDTDAEGVEWQSVGCFMQMDMIYLSISFDDPIEE